MVCCWCVWLVAIFWEQMFKWHQLRAESRRKNKKKRGWRIGQQTKGGLPLTPGPTAGRQHIWLEMNKEGRKALGHQQDTSSIFTHKAFILQMTPKNMYTTLQRFGTT